MVDIDIRPKVVNIQTYAGDTVYLYVKIPLSLAQGKTWLGQVRATRDATAVDATFVITPPVNEDDFAVVMLKSADSKRLAGQSPVVRQMAAGSLAEVRKYEGVYDVQISANGLDPVNTLVQGSFTIDLDVSRS